MKIFDVKLGTATANPGAAFAAFTDEKLYSLCQIYGERSRHFRQKFAGLLPEVFKRQLFKKKGFGSIYEFAAKLAGMSEEQVDRVLSTEKKFENTPALKKILENGEVSIHKLARVASVATPENEEFWAAQVRLLPKTALETLVRDEKNASVPTATLQENIFDGKFVPGHKRDNNFATQQGLNLSPEVQQKLLELQQKGIDINALLLKFLEERELKIAQEKEKLSAQAQPTQSRYIPAATRKLLKQEFGEKCSIKTCSKSAETIHHSQRFVLAKIHDPKYLAPLCENHHTIAHSIDVKFHEKRARN